MSATTAPQLVEDGFLKSQIPPIQELKIEEYQSGMAIRMLTPIGRASYVHIAKPQSRAIGSAPVFGVTLIVAPAACGDIWNAIVMLANRKWPGAGEQMIRAGQLHTPLKDGNLYFNKKAAQLMASKGGGAFNPALFPREAPMLWPFKDMFTINPSAALDKQPACVNERNQPCSPDTFYSGCYVRLYVTIATISDRQPTHGITAYLNSIQFARNGERLAGFDGGAAAQAAFAAAPLPVDPAAPPGGAAPFGGQAGPGGAPAGYAPAPAPNPVSAGFAAPPSGTAPWAPPGGAVPAAQPPGQPAFPPR